MGTRNLIMVVSDGDMKVAQYCQWDGYFKGQGKTVVNFIQNEMNLEKFKKDVNSCRFMTDVEQKMKVSEFSASGWMNMDQSNRFNEKYPEMSRDTGAGILSLIQEKGGLELTDSSNFANDSIFCEYAYLLDLDHKQLEVYRGFNKEPLEQNQRFFHLKGQKSPNSTDHFYPIKMIKTFPFQDLTVDLFLEWGEQYYKELYKEEDNSGSN